MIPAHTSDFRGQFLIQQSGLAAPAGFSGRPLADGLELLAHADLAVISVLSGGRLAGYLLGHPIELQSWQLLEAGTDFVLSESEGADKQRIAEAVLDRTGGSFVLVDLSAGSVDLYLDACGTLSLVYDAAARRAASTAQLLLGDRYDAVFQSDLFAAFEVAGDGWFTAGLTAHAGLSRLLVNHRLSMAGMTVRRHWPNALPEYSRDPDQVVRDIGSDVARTVQAIMARRNVVMALTGGFETRAMLACCRGMAGAIDFVTVGLPRAARDLELAGRIVRQAGLKHQVLPCRTASADQAEAWTRRAGHCLTGANRTYFPSVAPLAGKVLVGGLGGEVGRGFLWPVEMPPASAIDAAFLLDRLKLPRHPLLLDSITQWVEQLPKGLDAYQILDLAYVELRMGPWAFAQAYADMTKTDLHPLISRPQFLRMWSLPPAYRRGSGLMRQLISLQWPELARIPINAYGDWRDRAAPILRAMREPGRAWRKVRQIARSLT